VLTITVVGFVMLMSHTSTDVKRAAFLYPQSRLILAYIAFATLTVPLALYPGEAFGTAKALLPPVLFFLTFTLLPPRRDVLDRLQLWLVGLVLFFSTYVQIFGRTWAGRLRSPGGGFDSNDMASIMAMAFPLAAGLLARSAPGRARFLAMGAVVALVLGVIATGSRGGALALLAGALVFAFGLKGERGFLLLIAMLVGGAAAWSTAPASFRERMISLQNLEDDYNYTHDTGRKAVWKRGRQYWRENPIIGVGAGNFPIAEGANWSTEGRTGKWSVAHNAYIQAFAELGTLGGGLFVAILLGAAWRVLPFWRGRNTPKRERAPPPLHRPEFLASLAGYAAGAYFLSHAYFPPMFAVLGILALAHRVGAAEALAADTPGPGEAQAVLVRSPGQRGGAAALVWSSPVAVNRRMT
jgi:O-antigen ligase